MSKKKKKKGRAVVFLGPPEFHVGKNIVNTSFLSPNFCKLSFSTSFYEIVPRPIGGDDGGGQCNGRRRGSENGECGGMWRREFCNLAVGGGESGKDGKIDGRQ